MKGLSLAVFIASVVGVGLFMSHFWAPIGVGACVLWPIAGGCAIFSIYGGIINRSVTEDAVHKAHLMAAVVISVLVLLGLTLSAVFVFVPYLLFAPG